MSKRTRQCIGILFAIVAYYIIHEGAHLVMALMFHAFKKINFMWLGIQVDVYRDRLTDIQLGVFCIAGATATLIVPDVQMTEVKVMRLLDKVALRRIFDNILSNAARYTDGDLSVKLFSDWRITFSNHAAKLDRIQAERLFERFYTVESAKNSTGLGLSIARLLTEKMTGNIKAEYTDGELVIQVDF